MSGRLSRSGTGLGDFAPGPADLPPPFEVLVPGEYGGKARGLIHAAMLLRDGRPLAGEHTKRLRIPPSALLSADVFDEVVAATEGLGDMLRRGPPEGDEEAVVEAFQRARLPERARKALREWLGRTRVPLAVRSSSLQEDNRLYSFSGIYRTVFVANAGPLDGRLASVEKAVLAVLGSTFHPRAYAYRARHGIPPDDERMAVLLQHVVGRRRGDLFYPLLAGVGFSRNMYPWSDRISVEDGVVRLVYGLGTRSVDRSFARVFVPGMPRLRPEGFSVEAIEQYSQGRFDAIGFEEPEFRHGLPVESAVAFEGNGLHAVSSLVREGEFLRAPRFPLTPDDRFVVTFDEMIAGRTPFPLVPLLRALFASLAEALGTPVDVEFAATEGAREESGIPEEFHLLQVRPLGVRESNRKVVVDPGDRPVLLRARRVMGNGELEGIRHAVLVLADEYRRARPDRTVREIRRLNRVLEGKPFLLIGPGRWGSTNPGLGVPVGYDAVSACAAIVEVAAGSMAPEVSYGTHFFGDLLSSGTYYLAVVPAEGDVVDEKALLRHAAAPRDGVRLVEFPSPVTLQVDGAGRKGVAFVTAGAGPAPPGPAPGG